MQIQETPIEKFMVEDHLLARDCENIAGGTKMDMRV